MSYLLAHWSTGPFLGAAVALAAWHEIGLAWLARRSRPGTRQRRPRSLWFYSGLMVLLAAAQSPVDYWTYRYFFMHMIQHVLPMFAAPPLVIAGAPWEPLLAALPRRRGGGATPGRAARGRRVAASALAGRGAVQHHDRRLAPPRAARPGPGQPGHAPVADGRRLLCRGVLFWWQIIPSPPLRHRLTPAGQARRCSPPTW